VALSLGVLLNVLVILSSEERATASCKAKTDDDQDGKPAVVHIESPAPEGIRLCVGGQEQLAPDVWC